MFRPEGRISLKEVWNELGGIVLARAKEDGVADDFQSMAESTASAYWDFCQQSATARVVMPSGNLQSFDSFILRTAYEDLTYNEHIDLQVGTIGSGNALDRRESALKRLYGEALFCPVSFTVAEFKKFYRAFGSGPAPEGNSDAEVVKRIIEAFKSDPTRTSEEIRRIAAPPISQRHYTQLRARAAETVPSLIAGGRKPSKKP